MIAPAPIHLLSAFSMEIGKDQHPSPPFIAVYEHNGKKLAFLAARHERSISSQTFQMVDRLFDQFIPQAVLIEGVPYGEERSPELYARYARAQKEVSFTQGGESAYTAWKAMERGIDFVPAEPPDQIILDHIRSKGYTSEDLAGSYLYQTVRHFILNHQAVDTRYLNDLARHYGQRYGIEGNYTFDRFRGWYKNKIGVPYSEQDIGDRDLWPRKYQGNIIVEDLQAEIGQIREPFIVDVMQALLQHEDIQTLGVVYGAGHFTVQAEMLRHWLGAPVFMGLGDKASLPPAPILVM